MAIAALTEDIDADGVPDAVDNCTLVPNGPKDTATAGPSQNNTDADPYGNMCDADFNQDGGVNGFDLGIFKGLFFKGPGPSGLVP